MLLLYGTSKTHFFFGEPSNPLSALAAVVVLKAPAGSNGHISLVQALFLSSNQSTCPIRTSIEEVMPLQRFGTLGRHSLDCATPYYSTSSAEHCPEVAPHSNPHNFLFTPSIEVFLSILESEHYEPSNALGLTLVTLSTCGERHSHIPEPSPRLGSFRLSHQWRHKSRVLFWGLLCAHDVVGIPQREVRDTK